MVHNNRRDFLKRMGGLGVAAALATPGAEAAPNGGKAGVGVTFLFQGDSITDGNRTRDKDWNHVMGHGYAYILASKLWYEHPGKGFRFLNRGVSGNKVTDLAARWQADALDLKPDVLSILVGINDVTAFLDGDAAFSAAQYEAGYGALLAQARQQLPAVQLVLGQPFILPVGRVKERWEAYDGQVRQRQQIVKKLGARHGAIVVDFGQAFTKALAKAPADYWIWDGIHPMPAGHELMARAWLEQVRRKLPFLKT
jgi:lysophospholipase L1-like esterase